jgi:ABC-type sugar transport system ATPase subunit
MNLLQGTMLRGGDGQGLVHLSAEARLMLPALADGVADGERKVTIGIRPQDLRLGRPDEADALPATVFAFEPLQEVGRLTLTLPGVETRAVVETHHDFWATAGDVLGLRFNPARTHIFDSETGDRLAWSLTSTSAAQSRRLSPATSSS